MLLSCVDFPTQTSIEILYCPRLQSPQSEPVAMFLEKIVVFFAALFFLVRENFIENVNTRIKDPASIARTHS